MPDILYLDAPKQEYETAQQYLRRKRVFAHRVSANCGHARERCSDRPGACLCQCDVCVTLRTLNPKGVL
jgi:hypothetical protein